MTNSQNKKKQQKKKQYTLNDAGVAVFEDLEAFEQFIKDETEDEEFDHVHCQVNYYPPFVLHESHDDPEKIKDSQNSHSKKFVRHLHQHIERHLLKDIKKYAGLDDVKFKQTHKDEKPDKITWVYEDQTVYHGREFKLQVTATCHGDNAIVDVDYLTTPVVAAEAAA